MNKSISERALVFAPHGRDSAVACEMLTEAGVEAEVCDALSGLVSELGRGAGCAVLTEEALDRVDLHPLAHWLAAQPEWSDFPFILLTVRGGGLERNPSAKRYLDILGNVTFLERPFHPTTFVSLAEAALRGRRRQYEARSRLETLHRNEIELKASNDRFRAAIDAVQGVLWTNDAEGRMNGEQPGWAALTGQSEEEYRGHGWASAVHPEDREPTLQAWQRAVAERRTFVFEHRLRRRDGEWRNFAIRAVPIFDEGENIVQWVGVHTDITAQRAAESALIALNSNLEERVVEESAERREAESQLRQVQKMDAIGQLTGGVAHDFNNLLTPIMGGLDMLRQRFREDERAQRTISMALQATTRASMLVQRLLAFARRQDLQPRPVDISELLNGMEELVSRSIGAHIRVEVKAPADLPPARVDPNQLELAILNLAITARDAMPDGGTLRIEAGRQLLDREEEDLKAGEYVRIAVADQGLGMDEETLARATEPFFSTKGVGKGTGLGVSMVHGLAAQSGGALRLSSAPGEGTTAEIWLPVASAAVARTRTAPPAPVRAYGGGTILLVDDEELVRTATAQLLEELGYVVVQAGSGPEALAAIDERKGAIDALVTDFLMPVMNGAVLAQEARLLVPTLPVLVITGYSNIAEGPGAELPRLNKPFRQAELASKVAALIAGRPRQMSAAE